MNDNNTEFQGFPKIARLSREIVITEKIDGTNAQIYIYRDIRDTTLKMLIGSRSRWITPEDDNHGFARWAYTHGDELILGLGEGRHFGEWWGSGIQRGYGLTKGEKRFSLFNTHRWGNEDTRPKCCHVVPMLYEGIMCTEFIEHTLHLLDAGGSKCSPGFMKPEGVVIYHKAAKMLFKKTLEKDDEPKSERRGV